MKRKQIDIVVLVVAMCFTQAHAKRLYESTSGGKANVQHDKENRQETWQPMAQSNWIILNAASKDTALTSETPSAPTAAAAAILTPSNHRTSAYAYNALSPTGSRSSHHLLTDANANTYTHTHSQHQLGYQRRQWHKQKLEQPAHLAVNYYTYNNSSNTGNYQQQPTAPDVKLIEPYILTISKMRTRPHPDAALTHPAETAFASGIKLPNDIISNAMPSQIGFRQDIDNNRTNDAQNSNSHTTAETFEDAEATDDDNEELLDEMKSDGAQLNEILLPLQRTLDKVIYFCDMAKRFISNTDVDENDDETALAMANGSVIPNAAAEIMRSIAGAASSSTDEVQGQAIEMTQSRSAAHIGATTALTSVGTGRKVKKLKKKLSKFILPLLLAYKLKFLTLIPVLIGGLTLLVGTTGLAGFFFALFTAVMSLKSTGSSKSIIVKKI